MATKEKPPAFHNLPMRAVVVDKNDNRYMVVGRRKVPLSNLPSCQHTKTMISFRRLADGVTAEVGESAYNETVVGYEPPPAVRTRKATEK